MGIGDDEFDPPQAALYQTLQKSAPMNFLLPQRDGNAQNLALAVLLDAHGHQHGGIANLSVLPDFLILGVQIEIRTAAQRSFPPGRKNGIQLGGGPTDLTG